MHFRQARWIMSWTVDLYALKRILVWNISVPDPHVMYLVLLFSNNSGNDHREYSWANNACNVSLSDENYSGYVHGKSPIKKIEMILSILIIQYIWSNCQTNLNRKEKNNIQ